MRKNFFRNIAFQNHNISCSCSAIKLTLQVEKTEKKDLKPQWQISDTVFCNEYVLKGTRKILPWKIAPRKIAPNPNPNPNSNPNRGGSLLGSNLPGGNFTGSNFPVTFLKEFSSKKVF